MLTFGQVTKLSHFYTPDFPSGKSATNLNALTIHETVVNKLKKTP